MTLLLCAIVLSNNLLFRIRLQMYICKYFITISMIDPHYTLHLIYTTIKDFDFFECFTTTFLRAHSWLNWVNEDDDEVGLKEKPEDTRHIKNITSLRVPTGV